MPFDPSTATLATGFDPSTARPVSAFDPTTTKLVTAAPAADAPNSGFGSGSASDAIYAALHGAADTATFGMADRASAGLAAGLSHLTDQPLSYEDAYAKIKANAAKSARANPVSALVGDVGGVVAGGGMLSAGAKALKAAPVIGDAAGAVGDALALKTGQPLANVARSAAVGAGFGAADAAGHGGNADQIGVSAAGGAVLGPVAGKVAASAIKALSPAAEKAMGVLADKIGESPQTLQRAYTNFQQATGRVPTMAEIVALKTSGELRQVAGQNPIVGEAATQAADAASAARPTSLPAQIENITGQPAQDISTLTTARTGRMNQAMDPIRDNPVGLDSSNISPLYDPRVRAATNGDPALRSRIGQAIEDVEQNGTSDALTVNDVDAIRKSVRGRQSAYANPQATIHNPHTAESYGNLADDITGLATGGDPAHPYADALAQFEADSHYINGFKHGMAGKDVGEASTPSLINSLSQPEGAEGYASGVQSRLQNAARNSEQGAVKTAADLGQNAGTQDQVRDALGPQTAARLRAAGQAESTAADRLGTIAPGAPDPTTSQVPVGALAHVVGAVAAHSPAGLAWHLGRSIPRVSKAMPPAVQQKVAQYLLDPTMTQQGINLLKKAGATNDDLRRLALSISGSTGGNVGEALAGQ